MKVTSQIIATGVVLSTLFACQKEPLSNGDDPTVSIIHGRPKVGGMDLQWKRDVSGEGNHECPPNGDRCVKMTFLSERDKGVVGRVLDIIEIGDNEALRAVFAEEQQVLGQFLPQGLIADVIAGSVNPTTVKSSSTGGRFMIFGEAPNEKVYALK